MGQAYALHGGIWRIGEGSSVKVYGDPWVLGALPRHILSPRVFDEDLLVPNIISPTGGWNVGLIHMGFLPDEAKFILNTPIDGIGKHDIFAWNFSNSGCFSVKSGYKVANSLGEGGFIGSSSSNLQSGLWKSLWLLKILNKIKIFLWRASVSAIPTASALTKRKLLSHDACSICNAWT